MFDGAVLAIVKLAALFCCFEVEVFPADSKPHALELDQLLLVSNIFCGGLFISALRSLAEQRPESRAWNGSFQFCSRNQKQSAGAAPSGTSESLSTRPEHNLLSTLLSPSAIGSELRRSDDPPRVWK